MCRNTEIKKALFCSPQPHSVDVHHVTPVDLVEDSSVVDDERHFAQGFLHARVAIWGDRRRNTCNISSRTLDSKDRNCKTMANPRKGRDNRLVTVWQNESFSPYFEKFSLKICEVLSSIVGGNFRAQLVPAKRSWFVTSQK